MGKRSKHDNVEYLVVANEKLFLLIQISSRMNVATMMRPSNVYKALVGNSKGKQSSKT